VKAWWRALFPAAPVPQGDAVRLAEVDAVLAAIEPLVAADGGRIELRAVEGDRVVVALRGACERCSASDLTLRELLEPRLRERLAWFGELRVDP
jgi:NifU-like protein